MLASALPSFLCWPAAERARRVIELAAGLQMRHHSAAASIIYARRSSDDDSAFPRSPAAAYGRRGQHIITAAPGRALDI